MQDTYQAEPTFSVNASLIIKNQQVWMGLGLDVLNYVTAFTFHFYFFLEWPVPCYYNVINVIAK